MYFCSLARRSREKVGNTQNPFHPSFYDSDLRRSVENPIPKVYHPSSLYRKSREWMFAVGIKRARKRSCLLQNMEKQLYLRLQFLHVIVSGSLRRYPSFTCVFSKDSVVKTDIPVGKISEKFFRRETNSLMSALLSLERPLYLALAVTLFDCFTFIKFLFSADDCNTYLYISPFIIHRNRH